jgi:hypothetical protein
MDFKLDPHPNQLSGLGATGTEAPALVERLINKECPVSAALTDDDKAKLRAFQKSQHRRPRNK